MHALVEAYRSGVFNTKEKMLKLTSCKCHQVQSFVTAINSKCQRAGKGSWQAHKSPQGSKVQTAHSLHSLGAGWEA